MNKITFTNNNLFNIYFLVYSIIGVAISDISSFKVLNGA